MKKDKRYKGWVHCTGFDFPLEPVIAGNSKVSQIVKNTLKQKQIVENVLKSALPNAGKTKIDRLLEVIEGYLDDYAQKYQRAKYGALPAEKRKQLREIVKQAEELSANLNAMPPSLEGQFGMSLSSKSLIPNKIGLADYLQQVAGRAKEILTDDGSIINEQKKGGRPRFSDLEIQLAFDLMKFFKEQSIDINITKGKDCAFARIFRALLGAVNIKDADKDVRKQITAAKDKFSAKPTA